MTQGTYMEIIGADDGLPGELGLCKPCHVIAHFSRTLKRWVSDDGKFHTGHLIEVVRRDSNPENQ
jgi:hypothetical protein